MNHTLPRIMYDDPRCAVPVQVVQWRSLDGSLHATEAAARYVSCTHRPCPECGRPAEKIWTMCPDCRRRNEIEKWRALPEVEWDGDSPLYSIAAEQFLETDTEVYDFAAEHDYDPERMLLVLAEISSAPECEGGRLWFPGRERVSTLSTSNAARKRKVE